MPRETLAGLSVQDRPEAETEELRLMVPAKPLALIALIEVPPVEPASRITFPALAVSTKSCTMNCTEAE